MVTLAASLSLGSAVSPRAGLAALTVIGGGLAILGLLWGGRNLRREYRTLNSALDRLRVVELSSLSADEKARQRAAILPPSSTGLDVLYFRETVRLYVVQQASDNLGVPAGLTVLGMLASSAGGVWSLWV
ncbi:hypothetical protein ACIRL0_00575 [Streptomyces sp. NPDC102365]|uniref:hypothetical protein n=1 Tax=Streptomyces sp. NPDC102365 TaxID=3366162 RepID=UPI0038287F8A